jgi:hypothetical protein
LAKILELLTECTGEEVLRKREHTKPLIFLNYMVGAFGVGIFLVLVTALFAWPGWTLWINYELAHAGLSGDLVQASTDPQPVTSTSKLPERLNIPQSFEKEDWKTLHEKLLKKAESRSYENKMLTRELVRLVRVVAVALVAIAVLFPLTIWLLSRKRILGLSKLSSEMAATLVSVEERQAKLVNVLQELKGEIEYLQTTPSPDLKKLIEQAEMYIEKNTAALESTARSEQDLKSDSET